MHAELETALSELHLSTERWEAILAAAGRMTERENRRRPLRTGLMAAAICAALAVTAVAVSPPLRETLIQFLGSFEPYAQEVEGLSATDQGIELRVVRVLADKNGGTAYLEAEDLVGERLHESAALESYRDPCIAYDAEADTVLFALALDDIAPCQMQTGDVYTVEFSRVLPAVEPFFAPLPWELLTGERLDTLTVATEKYISGERREETRTVLVPGQTPAELGTELCSLSSMGFDQDGAFHIQLRLADGVGGEYGYLQTGMPQVEWEVGAIGEIHTTFQWEGISYYDIRFRTLTAEHFGQFRIDHIWGELTMGQPIEGEWTLSFPLELLQERTIALEEKLNRQVIREITLTATSLKTHAQFEDSDYPTCNGFPLTVYLTDGSTMVIPYNGNCDRRTVFFTEEDTLTYYAPGNKDRWGEDIVWYFPRAIDPREVTGIAIGQRYLPMNQDGTAGPGCWLDRLPE